MPVLPPPSSSLTVGTQTSAPAAQLPPGRWRFTLPNLSFAQDNAQFLPVLWGLAEEAAGALECPVCLGAHDDGIHGATLRVRGWFHDVVLRPFVNPPAGNPCFRAMVDGMYEAARPGD